MRLHAIGLALSMAGLSTCALAQTNVEFDQRFLRGAQDQQMDLSRFSRGNILPPGVHRYDVFLNDDWLGRQDVRVTNNDAQQDTALCFDAQQVLQWGLNFSALPDAETARRQLDDTGACFDADRYIPEFNAALDVSELTVRVSIPQAYLSRNVRGYVDPASWSQGVNAAFLNYGLTAYRSQQRGLSSFNSHFGTFNAGVNLGAWRLRYDASYSHSSDQGGHYESLNLFMRRNIPAWQSEVTLGQAYTQGALFNSVPYTGVQVNSDDRMLPDSLAGFAPSIRGVADSNARVSVFQGNVQVYETSVPPGPFEINDLYNSGYAGDLEVVVTEANGQAKRFTVPYASVSQLMRPGLSRYSVTAGQYRNRSLSDKPNFVQGTYQRGLSNMVTAYGGGIVAQRYWSGLFGLAFNTRFGAIAMDVTHSQASGLTDGLYGRSGSPRGQSYRLSFSKLVSATNTNLTLAAYRFSSEGYMSLDEYARARSQRHQPLGADTGWMIGNDGSPTYVGSSLYPQRHRFQLSISQSLGSYGSLYVSGAAQNYWNASQKSDVTYQIGYTNAFRWGSLNLSVSRMDYARSRSETQVMLSLNIPLGRSGGPTLSTSVARTNQGNSSVMTSVHGVEGERRQWAYNVYGNRQNNDSGQTSSAGGSLQYSGHAVQVGVNASADNHGMRQGSINMNGSLIAHPGGVNFTRNQGETFAVLHVPGAAGAGINGGNDGLINAAGYGVAANLIPYRNNNVGVDPKGASMDVEIVGSSKNVAPTAGAIVMLEYETRQGSAVLLEIQRSQGAMPPLGAEVIDPDGQVVAQVGQRGRIFARGLQDGAMLTVRWGDDEASQCRIPYQALAQQSEGLPFMRQRVDCLPVHDVASHVVKP